MEPHLNYPKLLNGLVISWAQELIYLHLTCSLRSERKLGQSGGHFRSWILFIKLTRQLRKFEREIYTVSFQWKKKNGPVKYKVSLCNVDFLRQEQNLWLWMILNVGKVLPASFVHYVYSIWICNERPWGRMKDAECDSDFWVLQLKYVCKNPLFCLLLIRTDKLS